MRPTRTPRKRRESSLAAQIALAFAAKLAVLTVLYFAFFASPAAPGPEGMAAAILGAPAR